MYPHANTEGYYPPDKNGYPPAPPPTMGIPVAGDNQYYSPAGPSALNVQVQATRPWSTGLCDCCDDVGNCCLTCFCPCITFGRIAEIVDRGSTSCGASGALYALIMSLTGCECLYSFSYRSKIRRQYALPKSPCNDCLVHCFCEHCALCQEYRELRNRGFDMELGWFGNLERPAPAPTAPPASLSGMTR